MSGEPPPRGVLVETRTAGHVEVEAVSAFPFWAARRFRVCSRRVRPCSHAPTPIPTRTHPPVPQAPISPLASSPPCAQPHECAYSLSCLFFSVFVSLSVEWRAAPTAAAATPPPTPHARWVPVATAAAAAAAVAVAAAAAAAATTPRQPQVPLPPLPARLLRPPHPGASNCPPAARATTSLAVAAPWSKRIAGNSKLERARTARSTWRPTCGAGPRSRSSGSAWTMSGRASPSPPSGRSSFSNRWTMST